MKKAKLAASLIAVSMAATTLLTGCDNSNTSNNSNTPGNSTPTNSNNPGTSDTTPVEDPAKEIVPGTDYKEGTVLRMATGYNNAQTGIAFNAKLMDDFGVDGKITLANGKSYLVGDLKPTWQTLEEKLKVKFNDVYSGKSDSKEFEYWKEQLDGCDILSGTASLLTEAGAAGSFVDLNQHLNEMPNFKAYLEANPIVRLSITGSTTGSNKGAIYFSPYFDGVDDIERMPLMRTDWVKKLLNDEPGKKFEASSSKQTATPVYTPYMPTEGKLSVDVVKADGSGVEKIEKDYTAAGNIIAKMNAAGSMSGVDAVNMLRDYIDAAYGGYYKPENRADLFIGQNAAWDADELVALLRCVVANPQTLNGKDSVFGLFSREDGNLQRKVDIFRFAGTLFGVRGLESRSDYLYVGNDGKLHDARMEEDTYIAMERMNSLTKEGLISTDFINNVADMNSSKVLAQDAGFMSYDYNQTQTLYNDDGKTFSEGEEYRAVMVPVAAWKTGADNKVEYMRFTESWRSVKTGGWGISVKGINGDNDKLKAALKLIDYAYSTEGQILMSYGPDEFIKMENGKYVYFDFNGTPWPEIADATREELWSKGKGNYTNYARQLLGSTLSFLKSQAFEYQCTSAAGREGAGYISNAIGFGTINHPELAIAKNQWYTSVPTVLPLTSTQNNQINEYTMLGSKGKFSTSKDGESLLINIIVDGYSGEGTSSRAETVNTVSESWGGKQVLALREQAWQKLLKFYQE